MNTYKINFNYTDEGFILLRAETEDEAAAMAGELLTELRDPQIIEVLAISQEQVEELIRMHTEPEEEPEEGVKKYVN